MRAAARYRLNFLSTGVETDHGKLLSLFAEWGMRLVIVPDEELVIIPTFQVGDVHD